MLYLLDANVLIAANRDYYPYDRIPQFWTWLLEVCESGHAKVPFEVFSEVQAPEGGFSEWLADPDVSRALVLDEELSVECLDVVLSDGYGPDLTDTELDAIGQDAALVAYGLACSDRTIVTRETSRPSRFRGNTKVPDACNRVSLPCINDFEFYRVLNFNTRP